jgi:xylose isomerase
MAGYARFSAHPRSLEEAKMQIDLIVEEVRKNGVAFAARHNNDLAAICRALKEKEAVSARVVINLQASASAERAKFDPASSSA